jgi:hypothetical protein
MCANNFGCCVVVGATHKFLYFPLYPPHLTCAAASFGGALSSTLISFFTVAIYFNYVETTVM